MAEHTLNSAPMAHFGEYGENHKTCMIYFVRAEGGGLIKIGSAKDARKRLAALQIASPTRLEIVGAHYARRDTEKHLHGVFKADRVRGEWFTPSDALLAFIAKEANGALFRWATGQRKTKPATGEDYYDPHWVPPKPPRWTTISQPSPYREP